MDVLETMHYKFQQSSPIYSGRHLRFRSSTECWTAQFLVGRLHARVVQMTFPGSDSEGNCGSAVAFL